MARRNQAGGAAQAAAPAAVYQYRKGFKTTVPADVLRTFVENYRAQHGTPCPPEVLAREADDPASPLYDLFEHDDAVAAREYRVIQAKRAMAAVRVVDVATGRTMPVYTAVTVKAAPGRISGYVPMTESLTDPDLRKQVLMQHLRRVRQAVQQAKACAELAEFCGVVEDDLLDAIEDLDLPDDFA